MRRLFALLLVLPLAACAGGKRPAAEPGPVETPALAPTPSAAPPTPAVTPIPAPPVGETATIAGMVTYRQRIALTPEAVVQIELRDVSRPDDEAPLVARRILEKPGQVPIAFTLGYDSGAIDPSHTYAISARITDRGQLQFVTETRLPVITNGAPTTVEIPVVPVP